jgi:SAM-dependent methyltransferase
MPAQHGRSAHWQQVYQTRPDRETSWFQEEPLPSLDLVRACAPRPCRVVDVGGGSSVLAGRLAAEGHDVTVLEISAIAIDRARSRIGDMARRVRWIVGDVTEIAELGEFDLWHDRAVFHFLTEPEDRRRYADLAARSVVPGGHVVIGTFALDGPERCSGLPVERYDRTRLAAAFGPAFTIERSCDETHVTPWGKPQAFFFAVLRRSAVDAPRRP